MTRAEIETELAAFIANEILNSKTTELDAETPLLEWGIIDSMSMINVLGFIEQRFGVDVPPQDLTAENFHNLASISTLLLSLHGPSV
jgi:acyl carrier protein